MNSTQLIGRLVYEGDLKYTSSGTAVYRNTLAVNRKYKKDEADFIKILAFKNTAELIANHLTKGEQVGLVGHINTGSYEKDGKKVYTFEVVVDGVIFIGSKKQDKPKQADPFGNVEQMDESDLPF
jgi:single-strand DNA-binding protein